MTHILFFYYNNIVPSVGGVERVVNSMYNELARKDYYIISVYTHKNEGVEEYPQISTPEKDKRNSKVNRNFFSRLLIENKINIVLNFSATSNKCSYDITKAANMTGVPIVAVYHNQIDYQLWEIPLFGRLKKYSFIYKSLEYVLRFYQSCLPRQARYVFVKSAAAVVLSPSYIDHLEYIVSCRNSKKIYCIPNPSPFNVGEDKKTSKHMEAVFVGRLAMQKNPKELLDVWSLLKTRWKLFVLGSGELDDGLKKYCQEKGLEDIVFFVGNTDPKPYYRQASVICMTSLFEGLPMSLIEALNYGCIPILYNSFPAASDFVKNNNGFLIANFDKKGKAETLDKLYDDDLLLESLSSASYELASYYSINNVIPLWEKLILKYRQQDSQSK